MILRVLLIRVRNIVGCAGVTTHWPQFVLSLLPGYSGAAVLVYLVYFKIISTFDGFRCARYVFCPCLFHVPLGLLRVKHATHPPPTYVVRYAYVHVHNRTTKRRGKVCNTWPDKHNGSLHDVIYRVYYNYPSSYGSSPHTARVTTSLRPHCDCN